MGPSAYSHDVRWQVDASLLSAPVIAGDVVLVYAATGAGTQTLNAWELSDGTLLWKRIALTASASRAYSSPKLTQSTIASMSTPWQTKRSEHPRRRMLDSSKAVPLLCSRVSSTEQGELRYSEHGGPHWGRTFADLFGEGTAPSGGWYWSDPPADDAPLFALGFDARSRTIFWVTAQSTSGKRTSMSI